MAKPITLVGYTNIVGAIYDPDILPSAVITTGEETEPYCMHSLRTEGLGFFDDFIAAARMRNGFNDNKHDEELQVTLYKFYEDFPQQSYNCVGCSRGASTEDHKILDSNKSCTKTTADCA